MVKGHSFGKRVACTVYVSCDLKTGSNQVCPCGASCCHCPIVYMLNPPASVTSRITRGGVHTSKHKSAHPNGVGLFIKTLDRLPTTIDLIGFTESTKDFTLQKPGQPCLMVLEGSGRVYITVYSMWKSHHSPTSRHHRSDLITHRKISCTHCGSVIVNTSSGQGGLDSRALNTRHPGGAGHQA